MSAPARAPVRAFGAAGGARSAAGDAAGHAARRTLGDGPRNARIARSATRDGAGAGRLPGPPGVLLVGLEASDPAARAALAARVEAAGHLVAPPGAQADVWLTGEAPPGAGAAFGGARAPALLLGEAEEGSAVPADAGPAVLDAALRAVAAGLVVRAPEVSAPRGFGPAEPARALLTPREVSILACLGDGLSNKAVARRLGISAHTVKFHLEAVFDKLGATSRAEAVAKGLRRGLIEL